MTHTAKKLICAILILSLCMASVSLAAPAEGDKAREPSPSAEPLREDDATYIHIDPYGHIGNEYFTGIGAEMTARLKELIPSAEHEARFGVGVVFNLDAALDAEDFQADGLSGMVIGIDPGHQFEADHALEPVAPMSERTKERQSAGGCGVRTGVEEHVVNLMIANRLSSILQSAGASVVMTRSEADVSLSNAERAMMMNDAGVDLWLRLHCESACDSDVRGCTLLIPALTSSPDIFEGSLALAYSIIDRFHTVTGAPALGVASLEDQTGFNYSLSPVVTVEMGCLSNPVDDILLNRAAYQNACAYGIYLGIVDYAANMDIAGDEEILSPFDETSAPEEGTQVEPARSPLPAATPAAPVAE